MDIEINYLQEQFKTAVIILVGEIGTTQERIYSAITSRLFRIKDEELIGLVSNEYQDLVEEYLSKKRIYLDKNQDRENRTYLISDDIAKRIAELITEIAFCIYK